MIPSSEYIGPYRLLEVLGRGGMGEVYRGHHVRLGRAVARQRIHPERADQPRSRARFLREARIAARLQHPALVSVHDVLEQDDTLWIVMELVEGEPLSRWLEAGPPPLGIGLRLALDMASGLAAIHDGGILHRDLDSKNIMVVAPGAEAKGVADPGPRARLLDFGLAKALDEPETTLGSTTSGLVGTPRAMSPEQARGEEIGTRSDLFALGTLLYELFTGISPFQAESAAETLGRICHHEPSPVRLRRPDLPDALDGWIGRLLNKDPSARPRSAHDVVAALDGLLSSMAGPAPELSAHPGVGRSPTWEVGLPPGSSLQRSRRGMARRWTDSSREGDSGESREGGGSGERRPLTVAYCELVAPSDESGQRSGSLDPEVLLEVLPSFRAELQRVLFRFGGYLGAFWGHRIELYFGWPLARENGVLRAVVAALALADASEEPDDPIADDSSAGDSSAPTLRAGVRVGVHTGPVAALVTHDGNERLALGAIYDRARDIGRAAAAGEVWISAEAHRRVEGHVIVESARPGPREAFSAEPRRVLELASDRDPTRPGRAEPPMVGRDRELDLLRARLHQASEGVGQVVWITADAGIGKTRLLRALRESPGPVVAASFWTCRGSSLRRRESLAPVVELTRRLLELEGTVGGSGPLWEERLGRALELHDLPSGDLLPTLGPWLGPDPSALEVTDGTSQRKAIRLWPELLLELMEQRFETEGPTVLIVEDLQWVDPSTLGVVEGLIEACAASPLLLLVTARPEFQSPWGPGRHLSRLRLETL
ncbi:MAG: protein kinase, partial [Holophagales bacterium]|nr:protein kinase [Holophagales bacterium]